MRVESQNTNEKDPGELSTEKAFVISVLIHVLLFAVGHNLPAKPPEPADQKDEAKAEEVKTVNIEFVMEETRPEPEPEDPPLQFAMIDPSNVSEKPPEDTKRYSFANSVASNPSPEIDTGQARIDGLQDKVVQTFDAPREQPMPLQPTLSKPDSQPEQPKEQTRKLAAAPSRPKTKPKAKPAQKLAKKTPKGNERPKPKMTAALPKPKPIEKAMPETEKPEQLKPRRPRTIAEAKRQMAKSPGQKMKQEGGVKNRGTIESINAKGSPMGEYDARLISAIKSRWYQLLDDSGVDRTQHGRVIVTFRIHAYGRVSEVRASKSSLGSLLTYYCEAAIQDPAPFEEWPDSLIGLIRKDSRLVQFTFYYN